MKFSIKIFLIFVAVTLIGAALHEVVREKTANSLGYHSYKFKWGQLWFGNDSLFKKGKPINETNSNPVYIDKILHDKDKWDDYFFQNTKAKAFIELSAKIFTFSVSFLGIIILYFRREMRPQQFGIIDWVGIVLSLFIMKQVFLSTVFILSRSEFCDYSAFIHYFKLPFWTTEYCLVIYGLLISSLIVFKVVPRNSRIRFFIAGLLGGLSGIVLWFFIIGKLLFG